MTSACPNSCACASTCCGGRFLCAKKCGLFTKLKVLRVIALSSWTIVLQPCQCACRALATLKEKGQKAQVRKINLAESLPLVDINLCV